MTQHRTRWTKTAAVMLAFAAGSAAAFAQPPAEQAQPRDRAVRVVGGGPMGQERKLVKRFDKDNDGKLDIEERDAARAFLKLERESRADNEDGRPMRMGFGPGPGGMGGMGGGEEKASPGPSVSPADVDPATGDLYDPSVMRTIFLDFAASDWEAELEDFNNTDVEVTATMTVDGKKYKGVGVHFRGNSSYFGVRTGHKRSLNVSVDFTDEKLELKPNGSDHGYTTLNLLNSHEDPSFMSSVLYANIANRYIVAPRANFVRVVINGESWGVYVNVEQFNKDFVKRNFKADAGASKVQVTGHEARWKVKGNPGSRSGLEYTGDSIDQYRQKYQIKSSDREEDWEDLINLCRVLNTTPPEDLEAALSPILDIDATLKFLALDVALANGDGYWTRASDYSLYKDKGGKFHIVPHDMNEAFQSSVMIPGGGMMRRMGPGGPGGRGGPAGGANGPGPNAGGPAGPTTAPADEPGGRRPADEPADVMRPAPRPAGEGEFIEMPLQPPPDGPGEPGGDQMRRPPGGRRMGPGGPGGGMSATELDPLVGLTDAAKPLRSKLLAVPALRERYLAYVRQIAQESLDWAYLGPIVAKERALIDKEIEADTRKLTSIDAFRKATADEAPAPAAGGGRQRESMNLRKFADKRRAYLLSYTPKDPPAAAAQAPRESEQR